MNQIFTQDNEKIIDEDAEKIYNLISEFLNQKLIPTEDQLVLYNPKWKSTNVADTILCEINSKRFVAFKKSIPELKMKRELLISEIKKQIGFPAYNVTKISIINPRKKKLFKTSFCELFKDWEGTTVLMIDFGNYKNSKKMLDLAVNEIKNINAFCEEYGRISAFNYLFGVSDRHSSNFVFFLDSQVLQSVDNEGWPFNPRGNELAEFMIIDRTRFNIQRFIEGNQKSQYLKSLRKGFIDGWKTISENHSFENKLNKKEKELFDKRISKDPLKLASIIFRDFEGTYEKWWKKDQDWWDTLDGQKFLKSQGVKTI